MNLTSLDFDLSNFTHLNLTLIILTIPSRTTVKYHEFLNIYHDLFNTHHNALDFDHPTSAQPSSISTMSHPNNNMPPSSNNRTTASGSISFPQSNSMSLDRNKQINGLYQPNNGNTISSLRQSHQPITPTPLRQNTTAASLSQIKQPVTAASSDVPFTHHKKTTSSSSLRQIYGISIKSSTTASSSSPSSSSQNNHTSKPTSTSTDPRHQNTKSMGNQLTSTNNKQTPQPHYSTPKKSNKRPYVDPRYDPNLTLAQRLEASTDLPLAPYSDYEWKMENEYESLTSWQPRREPKRDDSCVFA